ncbi:hypothetical protein [Methanosarcina sp. WH1]|uniref:hypothetical protein n=1 Tax=Methanosarcina sp. WH1 TaxID=1434102 RepID=UPI000A41DFE6|nr:hypothetical protein [Methanosarcina sp. WH1]
MDAIYIPYSYSRYFVKIYKNDVINPGYLIMVRSVRIEDWKIGKENMDNIEIWITQKCG